MGVLADWQIKRDLKITPFADGVKRPGTVSYGLSSYGYDARLGYRFKVFKPYPCSVIDPKNFDQRMLEEVDLTPKTCRWGAEPFDNGLYGCLDCKQATRTPDTSVAVCWESAADDHLLIPPHSFVLGETLEEFDIPRDVLCVVVGKSTYARCGLVVNVTPGEPEWNGRWTVELSNTTPLPLKVYPGEGIMQCLFFRSDGKREAVAHSVLDLIALVKQSGDRDVLRADFGKHARGGTCEVSYADKKGKYQSQEGLRTPEVDK